MKKQRCVIIGASPYQSEGAFLRSQVNAEDYIVCADGGYVLAEQAGIVPDLIIGDFDSSPEPTGTAAEILRLPVKKDDTDTMVCIKEGLARGYGDFLLLGTTGGRPDHTFANYTALLYLAHRGCRAVVKDSRWEVCVVHNSSICISDHAGSGFGIFPFGCESCSVSLRGFLYEGETIRLTADFPLGASNTVTAEKAYVKAECTALAMLEVCRHDV